MLRIRLSYIAIAGSMGLILCSLQSCNQPSSKTESLSNRATNATVVAVVPILSMRFEQEADLPAELRPFRDVRIHAKVKGFVSSITVDRGSRVRVGQILVKLSAPELDAECNESRAKVAAAEAAYSEALAALEVDRSGYVELKAKLDSDLLTLQRLNKAAHEPGAIAQNEIDVAQKTVEGDRARLEAASSKISAAHSVVTAKLQAVTAAKNSLQSLQYIRNYLTIKAPIDGLITERWVHEGDMAGVEGSRGEESHPLLRLVQASKLRLIVSVPESEVAGIHDGERLVFTVPAYLGREFSGIVSRIGHALDVHTRTMPVELDVDNESGELEPGMYATVKWRIKRPYSTLFLPTSALVTSQERTFVIRVKDNVASIVKVKTGRIMDGRIEVLGPVAEGDQVILNASDEYRDTDRVNARLATAEEIKTSCQQHSPASGE